MLRKHAHQRERPRQTRFVEKGGHQRKTHPPAGGGGKRVPQFPLGGQTPGAELAAEIEPIVRLAGRRQAIEVGDEDGAFHDQVAVRDGISSGQ